MRCFVREQRPSANLKSLGGASKDKLVVLIRTTFGDANNYMKNGTLMRQVINKKLRYPTSTPATIATFGISMKSSQGFAVCRQRGRILYAARRLSSLLSR